MSKPDSINMKKIFFVLPLFLFLLNPFYSKAQAPKAIRRNIIKTSPLAMLQGPILGFSEYRLQYERALTPSHAILISMSYLGKGIFSDSFYSNFSFSNPYATTQYNGYRG